MENNGEIQLKIAKLNAHYSDIKSEISELESETNRVIEVSNNIEHYLENFDEQFEKITKLSKLDFSIILFAAGLQTLRWVLMPELKLGKFDELEPSIAKEERMNSSEKNHVGGIYDGKKSGAFLEQEKVEEYVKKDRQYVVDDKDNFYKGKYKYRSTAEILFQNVPYDAINALDSNIIPDIAGLNGLVNDKFKNMHAGNHHVLTLGHDPVLGWIFGTANILTDTITLSNFRSFDVIRGHSIRATKEFQPINELQYSDLKIDYSSYRFMFDIIRECYFSIKEDSRRFAAAVMKQGAHVISDKYCIQGLPIPLLSIFDPKKSQELLEDGWNSVEFSRLLKADAATVVISEMLDIVINCAILALYIFVVDTGDDTDIKKVKATKILTYSNEIASAGNVLYVAISKKISKLDIAGISTTILALLNDDKIIGDIKREFIRKHMEELIKGDF